MEESMEEQWRFQIWSIDQRPGSYLILREHALWIFSRFLNNQQGGP